MTIDERLEALTGVVETLAASVVAHDNQIEALLEFTERNTRNIEKLSREWQAYLTTIHPKQ